MNKDSIVAKNVLLENTCKTCHWAWLESDNTIYCHCDMGFLDEESYERSRHIRLVDTHSCEYWEIKDGR